MLAERIERQLVLLAAVSARGLVVSSGSEFAFDWYYRSSASPRTTKHVAPGLPSAMHPRLVLLCVVGTGVWLAQESVLNRPTETNCDKRSLRDRVGNTRNDNIGRLIVVDRPRARAYSKRLDTAEEETSLPVREDWTGYPPVVAATDGGQIGERRKKMRSL